MTSSNFRGARKLAIVTGGNGGLGLAAAKAIAVHDDWYVILACRNPAMAEQAVRDVRQVRDGACVESMQLDLASLDSVRRFASEFGARSDEWPPLRALVCNAGVQCVSTFEETRDGFESTFGVNHLGHFLLSHLLLRHFPARSSPHDGRIVFVSSGTHDPAQRTGLPAPNYTTARQLAHSRYDSAGVGLSENDYGRRLYSTSKLCNVLCTYEFARRLRIAGVTNLTVNAFDPGLMPGTGLARDYGALMRFAWNHILPVLKYIIKNVHSVDESGGSLARLAIDPSLVGVGGKYFEGAREIPSSHDSYDEEKARDLWETSRELVHLSADDSAL